MAQQLLPQSQVARISQIGLFLTLFVATAAAALAASVSATSDSSATALVFEFSRPVSDNVWQTLVTAMAEADLPTILGRHVVFVRQTEMTKGTEFLDIVQVALKGDCATGRDFGSAATSDPLGWVYLREERIQPFIFVDCNRIAKALERELRELPPSARQRIMAYAISYVIAHELAHIATQSSVHAEAGLLKPGATKLDLLAGVSHLRKPRLFVPNSAPCAACIPKEVLEAEAEIW
jgi:hypothetical protein